MTWDIPTKNLERSLRQYLENGADRAFDLVRQYAQAAVSLRGSLKKFLGCNSARSSCCRRLSSTAECCGCLSAAPSGSSSLCAGISAQGPAGHSSQGEGQGGQAGSQGGCTGPQGCAAQGLRVCGAAQEGELRGPGTRDRVSATLLQPGHLWGCRRTFRVGESAVAPLFEAELRRQLASRPLLKTHGTL